MKPVSHRLFVAWYCPFAQRSWLAFNFYKRKGRLDGHVDMSHNGINPDFETMFGKPNPTYGRYELAKYMVKTRSIQVCAPLLLSRLAAATLTAAAVLPCDCSHCCYSHYSHCCYSHCCCSHCCCCCQTFFAPGEASVPIWTETQRTLDKPEVHKLMQSRLGRPPTNAELDEYSAAADQNQGGQYIKRNSDSAFLSFQFRGAPLPTDQATLQRKRKLNKFLCHGGFYRTLSRTPDHPTVQGRKGGAQP